jgi:hypothetical protein
VLDVYTGMLGIVGDRACAPLPPAVFRSSTLLCRCGWKLLADRSCRAEAVTGLVFAMESELVRLNGLFGTALIRGVLPCGLL